LPDDKDGLRDVTVNRPAPKSLQAMPQPLHIVCICEPGICEDTIQKTREEREKGRLVYSDQIMTISRHSASASTTAPPGPHGGPAPAAAPAAGGGSRRGRVRKGECQVNVSSISTVKSVKLQIYEKLHFSPTEQKLMHDQTELEEGDKTLADYGVPRDAVLQLHILSADGELDDGVRKGKRQREVDAGFSGTLLSGFGLECPSHSTEPIVALDSQDAGDDCHEGVQDTKMKSPAAGSSTAGEASAPSASVQPTSGGEGQAAAAGFGALPMTTAADPAAEKRLVKNKLQQAQRIAEREAKRNRIRIAMQQERALDKLKSEDPKLWWKMVRREEHVFTKMSFLAVEYPEDHQRILNEVGGDMKELLARARESARAGRTQ